MSLTTDVIDITDKCTYAAYEQSYFDPSDNIIFCHEFESGDYNQIFIIGLLMYLIYLGMYLLPFSSYTLYAKSISDARTTLTSSEGVQNLRLTMDESNERELNLGRYHGIPFIIYLFIHSLLSIIYLAIKLILVISPFDPSIDNRYKNVNERFQDDGFNKFVNAETIILTYLLSHNITNILKITQFYNLKQSLYGVLKKIFCILCLFMIYLDFIGSFILLCYKWSLLLFFLYEIAVGILIAFILILSCCFTVPCLICLIIINISLFTMCSNNGCCRFLMAIGSAIIFAGFGYLILCLLLTFLYLFVNGPSYSLIYLNLNDMNHFIVLILFAIATFIGLCSVCIGGIYGCLHPSHHQSLPNRDRDTADTEMA